MVELAGEGRSLDGYHLTAPDPDGEGAERAMRAALATAGETTADYVQAHGTSTPLNDAVEAAALRAVLGRALDDAHVSSVKGALGHAIAGAGALGFACAYQAVLDGWLLPTAGLLRTRSHLPAAPRARPGPAGGGPHRPGERLRLRRRQLFPAAAEGGVSDWARPVFVAGAGVVCAAGLDWRGLAAARAAPAGPLPPVPRDRDPCEPRRLNLMSRGAHLGAIALHAALADAGWTGDGAAGDVGLDVGLFMGVGASGGDLAELEAMLRPGVVAGNGNASGTAHLDLVRFGAQGLAAANPMFAFQLMNNFTLCHGAIAAGLQGPSTAFYSRGAGTVTALREAAFAIADGDVGRACAGGADSALHPVALAELDRAGALERGCLPGEGAALLVLAAECARPLARLRRAQVLPAVDGSLGPLESMAAARPADAARDGDAGAGGLGRSRPGGADVGQRGPGGPGAGRGDRQRRSAGRHPGDRLGPGAGPAGHRQGRTRGGAQRRPGRRSRGGGAAAPDRGVMTAVITGAGVVSAFGYGVDAFFEGLAAGRSAVGPIRSFDASGFATRVAGEVPGPLPLELAGAGGAGQHPVDRKSVFGAWAADQAWRAAGCGAPERAAAAVVVAVGLEQACLDDFAPLLADGRLPSPLPPGPSYRVPLEASVAPLCQHLGLRRPPILHVSACAAGTLAVAHAAALIQRGEADVVLAGGLDSMINPLGVGGMSRLGAPSPRNDADACRPFDRRRDGLAMGEGAAMFVAGVRAAGTRPGRAAAGARPGLGQQPGWLPGHGPATRRSGGGRGDPPGAGPGGPSRAGGGLRQRPRHRNAAERSGRGPRHPAGARRSRGQRAGVLDQGRGRPPDGRGGSDRDRRLSAGADPGSAARHRPPPPARSRLPAGHHRSPPPAGRRGGRPVQLVRLRRPECQHPAGAVVMTGAPDVDPGSGLMVVTGWAWRTPLGDRVPAVLDRLYAGERAFTTSGRFALDDYPLHWVAPLPGQPLPSRDGRFLRRMGLFALEVAAEALDQARPDATGARLGLFFGYGGLRAHWQDMLPALARQSPDGAGAWQRGFQLLHPFWMLQNLSNNAQALAAQALGARGDGLTLGGASAGAQALAAAARALSARAIDAAVVVGYDTLLEPESLIELAGRGAYLGGTAEAPPAPYDEAAAGFVPGEAAAALVLERSASPGRSLVRVAAWDAADGERGEPRADTLAATVAAALGRTFRQCQRRRPPGRRRRRPGTPGAGPGRAPGPGCRWRCPDPADLCDSCRYGTAGCRRLAGTDHRPGIGAGRRSVAPGRRPAPPGPGAAGTGHRVRRPAQHHPIGAGAVHRRSRPDRPGPGGAAMTEADAAAKNDTPVASSRPWALVTGGSRGLGAATAVALARRGFSIALGHHRHAAAPVADAVVAAGAEVLPLRFDVTDPRAVEVAFATLGEHLQAHDGALEALVCAAGITHDTLLGASDRRRLRRR